MEKNKEDEYREKWLNLGLPVDGPKPKKKKSVLTNYLFWLTALLIFIILYNWVL